MRKDWLYWLGFIVGILAVMAGAAVICINFSVDKLEYLLIGAVVCLLGGWLVLSQKDC